LLLSLSLTELVPADLISGFFFLVHSVDYLCFVHKQIQNDISGSGGSSKTSYQQDDQQNGPVSAAASFIDPGSLWRAAW
jgi:hypothetical protein